MRRTLYILSVVVFLTSFGPPALTALVSRNDPAMISWGEAVDLLTPFLVIGGILLLLAEINRTRLEAELHYSDLLPTGLLVFFSILMTSGHGVHLPSNALSHFLTEDKHASIYQLNFLYDEVISHYMWHVGAFGLSATVALYQLKYPLGSGLASAVSLLPPSLLYAFTFAFATIEGETVPVILPLVLASSIAYLVVVRRNSLSLRRRPVLVFFVFCCALMLFGWLAYAIVFGGLIPPTELIGNHGSTMNSAVSNLGPQGGIATWA